MKTSARRPWLIVAPLLSSLAFGACGGGSSGASHDGGADAATTPDAAAADDTAGADAAAAREWTWLDVAGSSCDEGTPTGIALAEGTSPNVLVYFEGGGACWDYGTCFVLNTTAHGPFGLPQWQSARASIAGIGPFDRARASNPYRDWSYVFIPYCTGDLHGGNNVQVYQGPTDTRTMHHMGRKNAELALAQILARWSAPARVVVSGTSAGGFGATFNYDLFRKAYPDAKMSLVDDAGPLLEGDGIPADIRADAYMYWHLGAVVDPLCPTCKDDLSNLMTALSTSYPHDRLALVSALTDPTVSLFFRLTLDDFKARLLATIKDRVAPTANARAYLVTGVQHGFLATQGTTKSAGVDLDAWLATQLDDATPWTTVSPP